MPAQPEDVVFELWRLRDWDDFLIRQFRRTLFSSVARRRRSTQRQIESLYAGRARLRLKEMIDIGWLEVELDRIGALERLGDHMAVSALFADFEIQLKRVLGIASVRKVQGELFKWREVERFLRDRNIDPRMLSGYAGVTELRLLNNAIKHSGCVGRELTRFGYQLDTLIPDLCSTFDRLSVACGEFLADICKAIIHLHDPTGGIVRGLIDRADAMI